MERTTQQLGYYPWEKIGDRTKQTHQKLLKLEEADTLDLPITMLPDKTSPLATQKLPALKKAKLSRPWWAILQQRIKGSWSYLISGKSS